MRRTAATTAPVAFCENCLKTERNLSKAYQMIESLMCAERQLSLAESDTTAAETRQAERRADLRALRISVAARLEEQR